MPFFSFTKHTCFSYLEKQTIDFSYLGKMDIWQQIYNKNFDFLDLFLKNSVSRRKFITHSQLCFTNCIIAKLYFTHYSCVVIQVCILYPSFGKLVFCISVLFAFYSLFFVEFNVIFLNFNYELHNNCLHGGMCQERFVFVLTLGAWDRN